jgi:hypothetical protein
MKTKQVKKGALDLKVKIIDWTPINKAISDKVGEQVECRLGKGFIEGVEAILDKELGYEEIKSLVIDNECCGKKTEKQNFYFSELNDGVPFCANYFLEVGFYKVDEKTENGKSISMFPSYEFSIDVDDVKKCLTGEEKSLFEFMGNKWSAVIKYKDPNHPDLEYFTDYHPTPVDYANYLIKCNLPLSQEAIFYAHESLHKMLTSGLYRIDIVNMFSDCDQRLSTAYKVLW